MVAERSARLTAVAIAATVPGHDWVLATDEAAGELIAVACGKQLEVAWRVPVSGYPVSVAVSADGRRAVVASLWSRRLTPSPGSPQPLPMDWQWPPWLIRRRSLPKCIAWDL